MSDASAVKGLVESSPDSESEAMISHLSRVQPPSKTIEFSYRPILSASGPFSNHKMKDCTSMGLASEFGANLGVLGVIWNRCTKNELMNSASRSVFGV